MSTECIFQYTMATANTFAASGSPSRPLFGRDYIGASLHFDSILAQIFSLSLI